MATNGIDKDYSYEVVIHYPVHFFVFRKTPNLTLYELKISDEELYQGWLLERDGNNFRLSQDLLKPSKVYRQHKPPTRIVNVEECEE